MDLTARWDEFQDMADDWDASCLNPAETWVPPNLGALVRATRTTSLARLYPCTAHACLCFGDRPDFWRADHSVAPAFISRTRGDGYLVWSGSPYKQPQVLVRTTADPATAASALGRLLVGWPQQG